ASRGKVGEILTHSAARRQGIVPCGWRSGNQRVGASGDKCQPRAWHWGGGDGKDSGRALERGVAQEGAVAVNLGMNGRVRSPVQSRPTTRGTPRARNQT